MAVFVFLLVLSVVVLAASGVPQQQQDEKYCDSWCADPPGSERFICCKDVVTLPDVVPPKPAECPVDRRLPGSCEHQGDRAHPTRCYSNSDCPIGLLCCYDACLGQTCKNPSSGGTAPTPPASYRPATCRSETSYRPWVSHDPHSSCDEYGYKGFCGESRWNNFCRKCAGSMQSPINLYKEKSARITGHEFIYTNYNQVLSSIGCFNNNGDYVECEWVTELERPTISGGNLNGTYTFASMHWHIGCEDGVGSDHTIGNESSSGELHLIHYKNTHDNLSMALNSGNRDALAVFGVFLRVSGTFNKAYKQITDNLVHINNTVQNFRYNYALSDLLPAIGGGGPYYRYNGSLTHPGCNEVVVWTVFQTPSFIDNSQIWPFRFLKSHSGMRLCNNHRKIQPQNGRELTFWE